MSTIADIAGKLRDTQQALRRAENVFAEDRSFSASLNLETLQKRSRDLERQFNEVSNEEALDICDYRLFSENLDTIRVRSFAGALLEFQELLSVVFHSVKKGIKERARLDMVTIEATAFDFGFCYDGSIGVIMTMPNDRLLIGETDLDTAIEKVFAMASSKDTSQIAEFSKTLGVPAVRRMFNWAHTHALSGFGADIKWRRANTVKRQFQATAEELMALQQAISQTSEESEKTVDMRGLLHGLDLDTKKFHLEAEGGLDVRGDVSPALGTKMTVQLGHLYEVSVLVKTKINLATDVEGTTYFLLKAEPI